MAAEKPGSKGQAWFCTTGLSSDVVIEVDEMSFHLHKFPLLARSKKLQQLIGEQEQDPGVSNRGRRESKALSGAQGEGSEDKGAHGEEEVDESPVERDSEVEEEEIEEEEPSHVVLPGFPGGADAFESAAKFCYGVKLELTPWNVAHLRCAAEYLEMTEEFSEDNLISRCESFLGQSIFRSVEDSVKTLKSCEDLIPLADALGIPQRCIDAIAVHACSIDPSSSLFGWPMNERAGGIGASDRRVLANHPVLWNGIDTGLRRKSHDGASNRSAATADGRMATWFDGLAILSLPLFKRTIASMKARGLSPEAIEGCLISYAKRSIPGLSRSSRKSSGGGLLPSEAKQRELLETVIENLPLEKTAAGSTRFLFGLLRTVNILRASKASSEILERKIASQLDRASLDDLLMPSYSYLVETLYDVDCIERILGYFLEGLQEAALVITAAEEDEHEMEGSSGGGSRARSPPSLRPLMMVGKLVDGYLSEIASDANLKPEKFCNLALALPDHARVYDDGLYRAIDVYLKAHPRISELDRERVCGVMDYQKLTLDACTHAAQNERLPLRVIVQVLFFEQLQLRHAIAGSLFAADLTGGSKPTESARVSRFYDEAPHPAVAAPRESETWRSAVRDNQVLRLDMDSMRNRVKELERECSSMKKVLEKMDRGGRFRPRGTTASIGDAGGKGWNSFRRKFGCKFKTQVCDSHERSVVQSRRSRAELAKEKPPPSPQPLQLQLQLQLEQSL